MPTLPTNPHNIGDSGHVNDHNTIVTALSGAAYVTSGNIADVSGNVKVPLGAWTSYTPTWSGISSTGGTSSGAYIQVGKKVTFWAKYLVGSSGITISGGISPSFPIPRRAGDYSIGVATVNDAGTGYYGTVMDGFTAYAANVSATYLSANNFSTTVPMTWAVNDSIVVSGTYEAA